MLGIVYNDLIVVRFNKEVTGNIETAVQLCEIWMQAYPRAEMPHLFLSASIYPVIGRYEKALQQGKKAIRLNPDSPVPSA
jgi:hypothetical protein